MYKGNSRHTDSLETGLEFQDFMSIKFMEQMGFNISIFQSKKYQFEKGESLQGIEIKYDARSTGDCTYYENVATGNVAVELFEKTNRNNKEWVKSGILRKDNTWIYVIGNYHQAWIFSKKRLQELYRSNRYKCIQTLPTIRSMLMPLNQADRHCEIKLTFSNNKDSHKLNGLNNSRKINNNKCSTTQ